MAVSDIFQHFVDVSAAIRQEFPNAPEIAQETVLQYSSSHEIPDLPWLQQRLPQLAEVLLSPPSFTLTLNISARGLKVTATIDRNAGGNLTLSNVNSNDSALSMASLPPEAQQTLKQFVNLFANEPVDLNAMVQQATALTGHGVAVALTLDLYLDKQRLIRSLENATQGQLTTKIVAYLFQDQLIRKLETTTIDKFESEFLTNGKRTVFLVFDIAGRLSSAFITVCGHDQDGAVEDELRQSLTNPTLAKAADIHRFRQSQSFGNFAPKWLMPEFFSLEAPPGSPNNAVLKRALQKFQPALAAIFMADFIETADGVYTVEYRGSRPNRFELDNAQLTAQQQHWPKLYGLYEFAYDGVSGDKLEIVQQFISQFADTIATLCAKATEIREAAKTTYDRTLKLRVEEYFEARQNVQERIQTAVAELTHEAITLSREVSADVYKVVGVIALAIAGSFFKADIGVIALMLGFLTIAVYLLIVVTYHLPTLNRATDLRKLQHDAYINSFNDVLTAGEIQNFLNNNNWREARTTFEKKLWWTKAIYWTLCIISFAVGAGILISMLRSTPQIPPVNALL